MIHCAIPEESLMKIKSDVVIEINESRKIINLFHQHVDLSFKDN